MDDKEKNQKTVVAFIAGLLIGGLLVWVFSIAPEKKDGQASDERDNAAPATVEQTNSSISQVSEKDEETSPTSTMPPTPGKRAPTVGVEGGASVSVVDQAPGARVAVESLTMPVDNGWIVIHETNADGSISNALGAARYSKAEGLIPKTVELLRTTESGKTYHAVLYTDNGDKRFNLAEDGVLTKGETKVGDSFKAN